MNNQRAKPPRGRKPQPPPKPKLTKPKDPVEVYCRIRPLRDYNDEVCATPISDTVVQLSPPRSNIALRNGIIKETQYTFKKVFNDLMSQKTLFDHTALPLVQDLLNKKNGLLFTYGVTGSGKTFTMTGTPNNGGILPRSLDVIFNSIGELQARKYVFKPDKMNGFDVQSEADAMLDRQKDLSLTTPKLFKTPRKREGSDSEERVADPTKLANIDEDSNYSVFVQYVEIYNNYIYDLLEDVPIDPLKPKPPQSKILREDAAHNMYIHGCTEIEVKSTDEAFEAFYKGQKRRRVAHTSLNTESSRSHSVFTIRLAQAPLDSQGEEILQDKNAVAISQLSLVDLAGSERTIRTKNCGDRLREAGNINNSLMVLRTCIEILRENQMQLTNKMVPYRDSKVTHLFKNYFDGEGKVRMIVCINPSMEDYDENVHVLRFAELTQEVQIARPIIARPDLGLTPGRRRNNLAYKEAMEQIDEMKNDIPFVLTQPSAPPLTPLAGPAPVLLNINFGSPFPNTDLQVASDEYTLQNFIEFLENKKKQKADKLSELVTMQFNFRNKLLELEKENIMKKQENEELKIQLDVSSQKLRATEQKLGSSEQKIETLQRKINKGERIKHTLENELEEQKMMLNRDKLNEVKIKAKLQERLRSEREHWSRETAKRVQQKEAEYKTTIWEQNEKLRTLRNIVNDTWRPKSGGPMEPIPGSSGITKAASRSDPKLETEPMRRRQRSVSPELHDRGIPVANPKHRRSRSSEVWIEHMPLGTVELGTILQPALKMRKSVSKLTVKDVTSDASKYVLTHQEQDKKGDVQTNLFKGNVIPTSGGGAQVIFDDVEVLQQLSPDSRKRNIDGQQKSQSSGEWTDTETRCATGIEGHTNSKKIRS